MRICASVLALAAASVAFAAESPQWAANVQSLNDVSKFGINCDSAPNRRWDWRYEFETKAS
jgi:hypothetical protein